VRLRRDWIWSFWVGGWGSADTGEGVSAERPFSNTIRDGDIGEIRGEEWLK